jgi:hypothetical protein
LKPTPNTPRAPRPHTPPPPPPPPHKHTHIHTHNHHTRAHTHNQPLQHFRTLTQTHTHAHSITHTCSHTHTRSHTHTWHTHTHTWHTHTHTHTRTHTVSHTHAHAQPHIVAHTKGIYVSMCRSSYRSIHLAMIISIYLFFHLFFPLSIYRSTLPSIYPVLQRCAGALQQGVHCRRTALRWNAAQGVTAPHDRAGVLVSVPPTGRVPPSTPEYPAIEPARPPLPLCARECGGACHTGAAARAGAHRAEAHPPHVSTRRVPAEYPPLGSHGARGRHGSTCGVPPRRPCAALVHSLPASHNGCSRDRITQAAAISGSNTQSAFKGCSRS